MKILAVADIHGARDKLAALSDVVAESDLLILAGDITNFGGPEAMAKVLDVFPDAEKLAVFGNCDHWETEDLLCQQGIDLHSRHRVVDGVCFVGLGGSLPCPGSTPTEFSEEELAVYLAEGFRDIPADIPSIFVAHQPPSDTVCDLANNGKHVGSVSVRQAIARHHPLACISGHIHEGRGTDHIGETTVINPGSLRVGHYALIELDDGNLRVSLHSLARR